MTPSLRRERPPSGFTLPELLVGLLLAWLLAGLALGTLAAQRRVLSAQARRAEILAAARVARSVLGAEGRAQAADGTALFATTDSLVLRAFRGQGIVCPTARAGARDVTVSWSGVRSPDAGRDSVIVVFAAAPPEVHLLLDRGGASVGCANPGGVRWERWTLAAPVGQGAVLVRYFRSVSYHLSGGAVRLRSGGGGRQPLTPAVLDDRGSGFTAGDGGITATLRPQGGGEAPPWSVSLTRRPPHG